MRIGFPRSLAVPLQCLLALTGLTLLALAPPANGAMLVISLVGEDASAIAGWATTGDTRLLGAGPLRGSLRISGSRDELAGLALRHGSLLLAGSKIVCGEKAA